MISNAINIVRMDLKEEPSTWEGNLTKIKETQLLAHSALNWRIENILFSSFINQRFRT